jgi:hypothetical protein
MPYSEKAKYKHNRQKAPKQFDKSTLKTVPLSHTDYKGKKFDKPGAKAIVGKLKVKYRKPARRGGKPRAWKIQSILIPKSPTKRQLMSTKRQIAGTKRRLKKGLIQL